MNRLKGSRTYLSGAMDRVTDGGVGWRNDLKPYLKAKQVVVIDPCDKPKCLLGNAPDESPEKRAEVARLKTFGDLKAVKDFMRPIRNCDLRFTDMADFLIVNLDLDFHPCGTYNEVFMAVSQKKPIIVRCEQGRNAMPNWLIGCIPDELFFGTWGEVKEYLRHVDEDEEVDHLGRWQLFDFDTPSIPD
jgi:hypothetical protein